MKSIPKWVWYAAAAIVVLYFVTGSFNPITQVEAVAAKV